MTDLNKTDLDKTTQTPQNNPRFDLSYFSQQDTSSSLDKMFPEQEHETKTIKKAKEILGDKYSTEDVKTTIASFEYLINAWLGEYEKKIFGKNTLKELLREL